MDDRTPSLQARAQLAPLQRAAMLRLMSLLPLPAADLAAVVDRALTDNPVLERAPGWTCGGCGMFCRAPRCEACSSTSRPGDTAAAVDWREDLRCQTRLEVPVSLLTELDLVVDSLDEHGLLTALPAGAVDPVRLQQVVAALRSVGPAGIAAASALDCVLVQVRALVERGVAPPFLVSVVQDWLPQVADGRLDEIACALGVPEHVVRAAVGVLTTSTRPFVVLSSSDPRAAPVDVTFSEGDGGVVALVTGDTGEDLLLRNDFRGLDADARAWLAPHREAAARLIGAVRARSRMLGGVADVLAVRQRDFLVDGRRHRPLRRSDVAAELGVHPSTVSRTVSGKVARCPDGRLLALRTCFGTGPSTSERVAAALAAAPGATDAAVAEALALTGPPLARRTVAKYRALARAGS